MSLKDLMFIDYLFDGSSDGDGGAVLGFLLIPCLWVLIRYFAYILFFLCSVGVAAGSVFFIKRLLDNPGGKKEEPQQP